MNANPMRKTLAERSEQKGFSHSGKKLIILYCHSKFLTKEIPKLV